MRSGVDSPSQMRRRACLPLLALRRTSRGRVTCGRCGRRCDRSRQFPAYVIRARARTPILYQKIGRSVCGQRFPKEYALKGKNADGCQMGLYYRFAQLHASKPRPASSNGNDWICASRRRSVNGAPLSILGVEISRAYRSAPKWILSHLFHSTFFISLGTVVSKSPGII